MKLVTNIFIAVFACACSVGSATEVKYPTDLAPSAQLYYHVKAEYSGFPLTGEADIHWNITGKAPNQTYSVSTETRSALLGKILEANSFGAVDAFGLAPNKYEEKAFRKTPFQTTFDRTAKKITFSEADKTYPLNNGEQDRTSAVWQLVSIARAAPNKLEPKSRWSFFVAGRRDTERWTFSVEKNVKLATPFGEIATVHIRKLLANPNDQDIDIWLAPSLEWYPVRIRFHDPNGNTIEQNLVRIKKYR